MIIIIIIIIIIAPITINPYLSIVTAFQISSKALMTAKCFATSDSPFGVVGATGIDGVTGVVGVIGEFKFICKRNAKPCSGKLQSSMRNNVMWLPNNMFLKKFNLLFNWSIKFSIFQLTAVSSLWRTLVTQLVISYVLIPVPFCESETVPFVFIIAGEISETNSLHFLCNTIIAARHFGMTPS